MPGSLQRNYRRKFDKDSYNMTSPGVTLASNIISDIGGVIYNSTDELENKGIDIESLLPVNVEVEVSQVWKNQINSFVDIPYSKAVEIRKTQSEFWQFNKEMTMVRRVHWSVIFPMKYIHDLRQGFGLKAVRENKRDKHDGNYVYTCEPFYRVPSHLFTLWSVTKSRRY